MNTASENRNSMQIGQEFLLAVFHSLLLLPILSLFVELNDLPQYSTLTFFFLFTQLMALFFTKWWAFFSIQLGSIVFVLYRLFPNQVQAQERPIRDWISQTWALGVQEWQELLSDQASDFPELLGILSILLLISLLTYGTIRLKKPIISFLVSFAYLLILHAFTANVILVYMIQVLGIGFLLISFSHIDTKISWPHFIKTTTITSLFTALIIGGSYWGMEQFRPTQEWVETRSYAYQQELNQRGFFDWINLNTPGRGFSQIGFSTQDDLLGGPLQADYTPLFRAYTSQPQYWKVMHRDVYTGLGWESQNEAERELSLPYEPLADAQRVAGSEDEESSITSISHEWEEEARYVAYPYNWTNLEFPEEENQENMQVQIDDYSDYLTIADDNPPESYTLDYERDAFSRLDEDLLREDDGWRDDWFENSDTTETNITPWLQQLFSSELYLPEDLPERVVDLAHDLTEGLDSEYEKVRAIETYLKDSGEFRYSLRETAHTPAGEDYVDHFLFETQVGYCDNFSSAMAVMLRAVDIPTRWATGFTPGTPQVDSDGEEFFQVTNSNAHSWTEVYFPSYGWVPFEPSPTFSQPTTHPEPTGTIGSEDYSFEDDGLLDATEAEGGLSTEEEMTEEETDAEDDETEEEVEEDDDEELGVYATDNGDAPNVRTLFILGVGIVFSIILFRSRYRLLTMVVKWMVKKETLTLEQASSFVLWLYNKKRERPTGHTVQQFFDFWKPFASKHERLFDQFIDLTNVAFYTPDDHKEQMSSEQKRIIVEMLDAFDDIPTSSERKKRDSKKTVREF